MTTKERLEKTLEDLQKQRKMATDQIEADRQQISVNEEMVAQIDVLIAANRHALSSDENISAVAQLSAEQAI